MNNKWLQSISSIPKSLQTWNQDRKDTKDEKNKEKLQDDINESKVYLDPLISSQITDETASKITKELIDELYKLSLSERAQLKQNSDAFYSQVISSYIVKQVKKAIHIGSSSKEEHIHTILENYVDQYNNIRPDKTKHLSKPKSFQKDTDLESLILPVAESIFQKNKENITAIFSEVVTENIQINPYEKTDLPIDSIKALLKVDRIQNTKVWAGESEVKLSSLDEDDQIKYFDYSQINALAGNDSTNAKETKKNIRLSLLNVIETTGYQLDVRKSAVATLLSYKNLDHPFLSYEFSEKIIDFLNTSSPDKSQLINAINELNPVNEVSNSTLTNSDLHPLVVMDLATILSDYSNLAKTCSSFPNFDTKFQAFQTAISDYISQNPDDNSEVILYLNQQFALDHENSIDEISQTRQTTIDSIDQIMAIEQAVNPYLQALGINSARMDKIKKVAAKYPELLSKNFKKSGLFKMTPGEIQALRKARIQNAKFQAIFDINKPSNQQKINPDGFIDNSAQEQITLNVLESSLTDLENLLENHQASKPSALKVPKQTFNQFRGRFSALRSNWKSSATASLGATLGVAGAKKLFGMTLGLPAVTGIAAISGKGMARSFLNGKVGKWFKHKGYKQNEDSEAEYEKLALYYSESARDYSGSEFDYEDSETNNAYLEQLRNMPQILMSKYQDDLNDKINGNLIIKNLRNNLVTAYQARPVNMELINEISTEMQERISIITINFWYEHIEKIYEYIELKRNNYIYRLGAELGLGTLFGLGTIYGLQALGEFGLDFINSDDADTATDTASSKAPDIEVKKPKLN
jgi:hypothetical protein